MKPPAYESLNPAELAALEELFRAEIESAAYQKQTLPDKAKLPAPVCRTLLKAGLIRKATANLPMQMGAAVFPLRIETYALTLSGHEAFCQYAATLPDEEYPESSDE